MGSYRHGNRGFGEQAVPCKSGRKQEDVASKQVALACDHNNGVGKERPHPDG